MAEPRVPVHGDAGHWIHVSESPRHVRVVFGGETIADSKRVKLLREAGELPVYYFPLTDTRVDLMKPSERRSVCPYKGEAVYWSLEAGSKIAKDAAWSYPNPKREAEELKDHVAFAWTPMDAWYEEDEEVYVHPRDPFKRVDVLHSRRHVRVVVDGVTVADTRRPRLLFETNHPVRYYIEPEDIRMELLVPSPTRSRCPYKGLATYWSVRIGDRLLEDLAWGYMETVPECPKIKGLLCFFQERGAEHLVDGEWIAPPRTKWARDPGRGRQ
ncbi:MAG TPA: DUF427 domain-containing protein [candidate division Zixibacteria bacterium]|nr:DUF427 domain-containing protein [candidate division Zixibacteria bacterium]